jgi:hypothetical protein
VKLSLKSQRRLASKILKVGETRVWFDPDRIGNQSRSIAPSPREAEEGVKERPRKSRGNKDGAACTKASVDNAHPGYPGGPQGSKGETRHT